MANYANGMETKGIIIDTCKRLFMEKGYKETTYSEIYKAAMVNPGTIAHHFGNKRNIASMLYNDLMLRISQAVSELFSEEDDLQKAFLGFAMHRKLVFYDERYRRFVMEFMLDDLGNDDEDKYIDDSFEAFRTTAKTLGEKKARFYFAAYKGIEAAIDSYYGRNPGSIDFPEMLTNFTEIYFGYLPKEEVERRCQRCIDLLYEVEIRFVDFNIAIESN